MGKRSTLQPQDKFVLRLPDGMREHLKSQAERNKRSTNAEIVARLEQSFESLVAIPGDLMDRIRLDAHFEGKAAEEEIIELLLSKYPAPTLVEDRLEMLAGMMADAFVVLAAGRENEHIHRFIENFEETISDIVAGHVTGVNPLAQIALEKAWKAYLRKPTNNSAASSDDDASR